MIETFLHIKTYHTFTRWKSIWAY